MSEVRELVKLVMDSMKNQTLEKLLKDDIEYQKRIKEIKQLYQLFEKLELTEQQRGIINALIARENQQEYNCNVNAYMAGMLDVYEILKMFNLTKE
ncbi:MAG: hypothetical protein HFJ03_03820 [Lachnospira sp.]|jgi:hypothetical protein|nr:hypothetical protein [Lachnospira sp.]